MAFDKVDFPGNFNDPFEPQPMGGRVSCFWHEKNESISLDEAEQIYSSTHPICIACGICEKHIKAV